MTSRSRTTSWFDTMRRDGVAFSMLGAFVLLLNLLQPLAAQAGGQGGFVICTIAGVQDGGSDLPAGMPDDCPVCVGANHCGGVPPLAKVLPASAPAFAAPAAFISVSPVTAEPCGLAAGPEGPPPAIRAPPFGL